MAKLFFLLLLLGLTGCATQRPLTVAEGPLRPAPGNAPLPPKTLAAVVPPGRDSTLYRQGESFARSNYHVGVGVRVGAFFGALATGPIVPVILRETAPRHIPSTHRVIAEWRLSSDVVLRHYKRVPIALDAAVRESPDFMAGYRHQVLQQRRQAIKAPAIIGGVMWGVGIVLGVVVIATLGSLGGNVF